MKKIVITLIASLAVIVLAILLKNEYSCKIPIHNRGIEDAISQGPLDVLFIGSSTFRSNIDMPSMDDAYDGKVYTIAYGGNQLVASDIQYDELKSRTDDMSNLIVMDLDPLMLTEEVKLSDSRVIWDLSFDGKKRLYSKMAEAGNTDLSVMFEYFVSSGMDDLITYPVTERIYATRYYKGAKTDETPSSGLEYLENEKYDISDAALVEAQIDALIDLIEKSRNDSQKMVFLECPKYHRLQSDSTYLEMKNHMIDILDSNGADYITAEDIDFDNSNPDYYEDMSHMSAEGRRVYTAKLIEYLASLDI